MAVAGFADVALDIFGGLVTDMAAADLPFGVSPDCQDVAFSPGSVRTRPGLQPVFSAIAGLPKVNYIKSYITQTNLLRLLALDAAGSLWKESSVGVLSLINSAIVPGSFGKSASLFTREYIALGDGRSGIDIPRQFDDVNFDRVSQVGPGQAPSAVDESVVPAIVASPSGAIMSGTGTIASAAEVGNICTLTFSVATDLDLLHPGDQVQVAGVGVGGYNGTFTVVSNGASLSYFNPTTGLGASSGGTAKSPIALFNLTAAAYLPVGTSVTTAGVAVAAYNGTWTVRKHATDPSPTTAFFYANIGTFGNAASGNGTATINGNVSAGTHRISVSFVTRQGYITEPAPTNFWVAAGSKRVVVTNIPIGPPNVIARLLMFTLAGQFFFFYSGGITGISASNFLISDNTTTTVTVDFSDAGLASQTSADNLFRLEELGECSGVIGFAERLFWWGERQKIQNVVNFTFDGGFSADGLGRLFPLGWTEDAIFYPGGSDTVTTYPTLPIVWGNAYSITGNGATPTRGLMTQSVYQDFNGVAIIQQNVGYSVRARLARNSTLATGTVHIHLQSTSLVIDAGLDVTAAQLGTAYAEFSAVLTAGLASPPQDLVIKVFADGTPTNNGVFLIENIEIYPTAQPFIPSQVRASRIEDPESYDGVNGFLSVNDGDGFGVRAAFVLRDNLYFVKDQGIYSTQDDGTNEPSLWKLTEVSRKVGTPSVNGVAVGEDWAVIAHRTGLYITSGGEPTKISQEIQPTWDRINWQYGQTIWTSVDTQNRRILVGVPLDSATSPNRILQLDYRGMDSAAEIASGAPIHTSYSGKLLVREISRKWSPWTIASNCGAIVERFDGTQKTFIGNGSGTGKIYQLTEQIGAGIPDDGAAIPSYYTTYFHFTHDLEQALQLGGHNKLFTYLSQFVEGNGQLVVSAVFPGGSTVVAASLTMQSPALRDVELPINVAGARMAFKVAVSNLGEWFSLARFIVDAVQHPSAPVRGWN